MPKRKLLFAPFLPYTSLRFKVKWPDVRGISLLQLRPCHLVRRQHVLHFLTSGFQDGVARRWECTNKVRRMSLYNLHTFSTLGVRHVRFRLTRAGSSDRDPPHALLLLHRSFPRFDRVLFFRVLMCVAWFAACSGSLRSEHALIAMLSAPDRLPHTRHRVLAFFRELGAHRLPVLL